MRKKFLIFIMWIAASGCILASCGNSVQNEKEADTAQNETIQNEEEPTPTDETEKTAGKEDATGEAVSDITEVSVNVPSKEMVLDKREACLEGMAEEDITRLTENIKTANLALENGYLYDRLFERMADPEDLYWNFVDQKGEIQIGYSMESDEVDAWKEYSENAEEITDMDSYWQAYKEYEAEHGQPVYIYNRFDADGFIDLMEEMKGLLKNDALTADLDSLIENMRQAKESHDVAYIQKIYYILHDMDYYLLRYAPDDVAPFVQDKGTIAVYYGALQVYQQEISEVY